MEAQLLGENHPRLVTGFTDTFERVKSQGQPEWISLVAPSGWGKTRIVQECYANLAAHHQGSPPYWPHTVHDGNGPAEPHAVARKRVFPTEFNHTEQSLPAYLWWGIACTSRNSDVSVALTADIGQLNGHAEYLDDVWRTLTSWRARLAPDAKDLTKAIVDDVLGAAVDIPGLSLLQWAIESSRKAIAEQHGRDRRLASAAVIAADHSEIAEDAAKMIGRLAIPGLPVVIAVEDVHAADPLLCEFLGTIVAMDAAVVIISTGQSGHTDDNHDLGAAFEAAVRLGRLHHVGVGSGDPGLGGGAVLRPLDKHSLGTIVHRHYPMTDDETLKMVTDRFINPNALEMFCQLERTRSRARDGRLAVAAQDLATAPQEIRITYRTQWEALPSNVRRALAFAAVGIPAEIHPEWDDDLMWDNDLISQAIATSRHADSDATISALCSDVDRYGWGIVQHASLHSFFDTDQRHTAATDDAYLTAADRERARRLLAGLLIVEGNAEHEDPAIAAHRIHVLCALHASGLVDDTAAVQRAAQRFLDQHDDPITRARIAGQGLVIADRHPPNPVGPG